ncbi:putative Ig domain-containing protein, partial [Saccharophagus degradans]
MRNDKVLVAQWVKSDEAQHPRRSVNYSFIDLDARVNVVSEFGLQLSSAANETANGYTVDVWTSGTDVNATMKNNIRDILNEMENFLSLDFTEVSFGEEDNVSFGFLVLPLRTTASGSDGHVGGRTLRGAGGAKDQYVFLHKNHGSRSEFLSIELLAKHHIRHELMHAIGFGPDFSDSTDPIVKNLTQQYSVLSYILHPSHKNSSETESNLVRPTTFMVYDYLAFDMVGILTGYDAGNEHEFKTTRVLETIYDTVGVDLFDASNQSDSIIDLRQGQYSSIGSGSSDSGATGNGRAVQNVGMAYGTIIENAVAGSGEDVIIGNAYNNVLNGKKGDDYIYGDGLSFNADDWASNFSPDHIDAYRGLIGTSESLIYEIGEDTLIGADGNDHLYGGAGNDHLLGDSDSAAFGGPGEDYLDGGAGNDTLEGGKEFDSYYFNYGDGIDEIIEDPGDGSNDLWLQHGASDSYTNVKRLGRMVTAASVFTEVDVSGEPINDTTIYVLEDNELGEQDLVVHIDGGKGGNIRIKNFGTLEENSFGISFVDPEAVKTPEIVEEERLEIGAGLSAASSTGYYPRDGFSSSDLAIKYDAKNYVPNSDANNKYFPGPWGSSDTLLNGYKFYGGNGNDVLIGGKYATEAGAYYDELRGGIGDDHLYGEALDSLEGDSDFLHGGEGNDTLLGFFGDDNLQGGIGEDHIEGGDGEDKIYGGGGSDYIVGGNDNDTIFSAQTPFDQDVPDEFGDVIGQFFEGKSIELDFTESDTVYGGDGDDRITGSAGDDKLLDLSGERSELYGFIGNDTLITGAGQDIIYGDAYFYEVIEERGGGIYSIGFTQFDWSVSDDYDDLIISGAGVDTIFAGAGNDSVFAGADSDVIFGDQANDAEMNGFLGDDGYVGLYTIYQYYSDLEPSLHGEDFLDGGSGNDFIYGNGGNDTITGGDGQDYIHGDDFVLAEQHHGSDTLLGGAGVDYLLGGGGKDKLEGGAGNDVLYGDSLQVEEIGVFAGASVFSGRSSIFNGRTYTQSVTGDNDILNGGAGSDIIFGDGGDDILIGGVGDDHLFGGAGNDTYIFNAGDGVDTINDTDIKEVIIYDSVTNFAVDGGDAILQYGSGTSLSQIRFVGSSIGSIENLVVASLIDTPDEHNNVIILSSNSTQLVDGGDGDDLLISLDEGDTLRGGAGRDYLLGGGGDDILDGGTALYGADYLAGGAGNDTYQIAANATDTYINNRDRDNGNDTIRVFGNVSASSAIVSREEDNLVIGFNNDLRRILVEDHFKGDNYSIDSIIFDDTSKLTSASILTQFSTNSNSSNTVIATQDADQIFDLGGDDLYFGDAGADEFIDGSGNDIYYGGEGDDIYAFSSTGGVNTIVDSAGINVVNFREDIAQEDLTFIRKFPNDLHILHDNEQSELVVKDYFEHHESAVSVFKFSTGMELNYRAVSELVMLATEDDNHLVGSWSNEILDGKGGNDLLAGAAGDDTLFGGDGLDELNGGSGNDELTGGLDDDLLAGGSGDDTYYIALNDGNDIIEHQAGVDEQNVIVFSDDVDPASMTVYREGGDLTLVRENDQTTTIKGYSDGALYSLTSIEFTFGVGSQWSVSDINSFAVSATEGNDIIFGDADANTIVALAGNDEVRGFDGGDNLSGGVGRDTLYGGGGDDTINGNEDDDTLIGGAGNDTLYGGDGEDDYYFSASDGQDKIVDADIGVLNFTSTVTGNYSTSGNSVRINDFILNHGTEDYVQLTRAEMLTVDDLLVAGESVDSLRIESDLVADTLIYFSGDDVLHNSELVGDVNKIYLGEGANSFYLDGDVIGSISVIGGSGNDSFYLKRDENINITGGGGEDRYLVDRFSGTHTLRPDDDDVIVVQEDLINVELNFSDFGRDLQIGLSESLEGGLYHRTTLDGFFQSQEVASIQFGSGEILTQEDILSILLNGTELSDTIHGTDFGNKIFGNGGSDQLYGRDGSDELFGGAGDDTLAGGRGDDLLDGGVGRNSLQGDSGSNIYIVGAEGAEDTINNFSTTDPYNLRDDVIEFASGIIAEDLVLSKDRNDLLIGISSNSSSVIVKDYFSHLHIDGRYSIDKFIFSNGDEWSFQDVVDQFGLSTLEDVFKGTDGDDEIYGSSSADVIKGGLGNDVIKAGSGNNIVYGGADNDEISGSGELHGDDGKDVLTGTRASGDKLYGGDGDDELEDGKENYGGAGDDKIHLGGYRNDSITVGGEDDDDYYVSSGSATLEFSFSRGDGRDTFVQVGTGSNIVLNFDETVKFSDIHLTPLEQGKGSSVRFELSYGEGDSIDFGASRFVTGYSNIEFNFESDPSEVLTIEDLYLWSLATTNESDTISLIEAGVVDLKAGDDQFFGSSWDDDVRGGAGKDVLEGGSGKDIYRFAAGDGVDTVIDDQGESTFIFDSAVSVDDLVLYRSGQNLIIDLPENNITYQNYYSNNWYAFPALTLSFADGQILIPNEEFVELIGAGSDRDDNIELYDHPSFDYTVVGGLGNDVFYGSASSNTFMYASGDGHDIIDLPTSSVSNELIVSGVDASDIVWSVDGYDLVIRDTVGLGSIRVNSYIGGGILNTINTPYVRPIFDSISIGENVYSGEDIKEFISAPSNENNFIFGNENEDAIEALGGDDWVIGTSSSDVVYGGDGEDVINGFGGDDVIYGEGDADIIYGSAGSDRMFGGDGDDILKSDGDGNYFDGGGGNDTLIGRGDFVFYNGSGVDHVSDIFESKFIFENINYDDVLFVRDIEAYGTYDVTVEWNDGEDAVVGVFQQDTSSRFRVQTLDFQDRELLSYSSSDFFRGNRIIITNGVSKEFVGEMTGNPEDYWELNGVPEFGLSDVNRDFSDVIHGGDANEIINSRSGPDTVYGGAGNDILNGGAGSDSLDGGSGNDTLNAGNYYSNLRDEWLFGDSLTGGLGNDTLTGSFTSDKYYFNIGDGYDVIYEDHSKNSDVDDLYFYGSVTKDDLVFSNSGNNLVINYGVRSEIQIDSFFSSDSDQLADGSDQWRVVFESQPRESYSLAHLLSLDSGSNIHPVVAVSINDKLFEEDSSFSFTIPANTFSDADGDSLSLNATLADGSALPAWLNFDSATSTFTGTPANENVGELEIRV